MRRLFTFLAFLLGLAFFSIVVSTQTDITPSGTASHAASRVPSPPKPTETLSQKRHLGLEEAGQAQTPQSPKPQQPSAAKVPVSSQGAQQETLPQIERMISVALQEKALSEAQRSFDRSISILSIAVSILGVGIAIFTLLLAIAALFLELSRRRLKTVAKSTKEEADKAIEMAKTEAQKIQEVRKDLEVYYYLRQGSDYISKDNYPLALRMLDKLHEIDPQNTNAWIMKAAIFQRLRKFEDQLQVFNRLLEFQPDAVAFWYAKGEILHRLERDEEALKAFDQALNIDPKSCVTLNGKGNSLVKLRKLPNAKAAFQKALAVDPEYAPALYNLATTYCLEGNKNEALSNLKGAIERDQRFKETAKRDSYFNAIREDKDFKALVE